ncbi:type IVB secretion system protein IcmW [Facilibium subflavum]|uniref:type IVB secretion system protein IcmW n=1 Tax=Facilibium subflavum TaxID=2219058 RepID=UPI000E647240|nr:hypothetical protein [Facilibium subflavum]
MEVFKEKIAQLWHQYDDGLLNVALMNLDEVKREPLADWQIKKLEAVIERFKSLEYTDARAEALLKLCDCLDPLVMLYAFHSLRQHNEDFIQPLMRYINENQHQTFVARFKKRNIAFEKMQILSQVFNNRIMEEIQICIE